jgi:hypothetical protein
MGGEGRENELLENAGQFDIMVIPDATATVRLCAEAGRDCPIPPEACDRSATKKFT